MQRIATQMGLEDAVRFVAREFGRFAGKGKLVGTAQDANVRRLGEVELRFDTETVGMIHVRFITPDDIDVKVGVQMLKLDRMAMARLMKEVVDKINEHKAKRRKQGSNIIWLPGSAR